MNDYELILFMWVTILTLVFIHFVIDMLKVCKKLKESTDELKKPVLGGMNKYIKKPVEVEALQIHENTSEIKEFIGENGDTYIDDEERKTVVVIYTLEGDMKATDGDYIIKGVKGEFYPCRGDIFEETYELVGGQGDTYE